MKFLKDRARLLADVRLFFAEKDVLEVDTPILSPTAPIDPYIEVIHAEIAPNEWGFFHSSPEYQMKKLLSQGSGDIYQLSHVFRKNEKGRHHSIEFTMLEWYRMGFSLNDLIKETLELCFLFLGERAIERLSYEKARKLYDLEITSLPPPHGSLSYEEQLDYEWAFGVEPHLGNGTLTVIEDFPPHLAALSKIENGVACRFEIYANGIELANGYDELLDANEQLKRLEEGNATRKGIGKAPYPIDWEFIEALRRGIPPCTGVAVGFDRLMMLRQGSTTLHPTLDDRITPAHAK